MMPSEVEEILREIGNSATPLRASVLAGLTDLSSADLEMFKRSWGMFGVKRQREIVSLLLELVTDNVEMNFDGIFKHCLNSDKDPLVLEKAIEGLWENEEASLIRPLIKLLGESYPAVVQAAAALALGKFSLLAEHTKINSFYRTMLLENLLNVFNDHKRTVAVRRRVLEAMAPLCFPQVQNAIREAYGSPDAAELVAGAIYSMGKSCDPVWLPILLDELAGADAERRYEAATACGEMEHRAAVPGLISLVDDPDASVSIAAIGALGKIGGTEAKRRLERCLTSSSAAIRQAARDALEELSFWDNPVSIPHETFEQDHD